MNIEEFLTNNSKNGFGKQLPVVDPAEMINSLPPPEPVELDVQKAVVEAFAEEKISLTETIDNLRRQIDELERTVAGLQNDNGELKQQISSLESDKLELNVAIAKLKDENSELSIKIQEVENREWEIQSRNPNSLALLDRDVELPDRFPGETRDHVLEVLKRELTYAESRGLVRKAQILESVLVTNEPCGELKNRRQQVEQLFREHNNLIDGTVIEELKRLGVSHKNGEEYLLPKEILLRNF